MRATRKLTVHARGPDPLEGDAFDDGIDITLRLAVRHRVARRVHLALEECCMADPPFPHFWAAWNEGLFLCRGAAAPAAPEVRI